MGTKRTGGGKGKGAPKEGAPVELREPEPAEPPVPVVGFESLRIVGDVWRATMPNASLPRLVRVGADDVAVVYAARTPQEVVSSQLLQGALTQWPPVAGEPVVHVTGPLYNSMGAATGGADGLFCAQTGQGFFCARAGQEGTVYRYRGLAFLDPRGGGLYTIERTEGTTAIHHRAAPEEATHVTPCGRLPPEHGINAGAVVEDGRLVVVSSSATKSGTSLYVWLVSGEGMREVGTLAAAGRVFVDVIRKPGGGAFVVVGSHGVATAHSLGAEGELEPNPWRYSPVSKADQDVAAGAWRGGFALATSRGGTGLGVLVSDGERATYVQGNVRDSMAFAAQRGSLIASDDGSVVLFAYQSGRDVHIARLECGPGDPANAYVMSERLLPPDMTVPARPEYRPSPFGVAGDVIRRARQLLALDAIQRLRSQYGEADGAGTRGEGWCFSSNGQGDHVVVFWSSAGLVGLGFDHESAESEWETARDQRNPAQHLENVPEALRPLADRACDFAERLATCGFWIAAGEKPAHNESGELDPCSILTQNLPGDGPMAVTARIAGSDDYTITAEDERVLFAPSKRGEVLEPKAVAMTVKALAKLGVKWPDAEAHAAEVAARELAARDARISEPTRALFQAAQDGDLEGARAALAGGASIDCAMPENQLPATPAKVTPLIVAMRRDHHEVALYLIEAGANIDAWVPAWGSGESALLLAAQQGNKGLTKLLLERGASVMPDRRSWGVLQAVAYPRDHLRRGAAADYVEVLRLLLDAGAPLPNEHHCTQLANMARQAGALDVARRLRPEPEADLPTIRPLPDTAAAGPKVAELLEAAAKAIESDTVRARELLEQAWRASLSARIGATAAALANYMAAGYSFTYVVRSSGGTSWPNTFQTLERALTLDPDPRAAGSILGFLRGSASSGDDLARCEDAMAKVLVHARDRRHIEVLEQLCELGRPWDRSPFRESLVVALQAAREVVELPLGPEHLAPLGAIEDHIAMRKGEPRRLPTVADLYEAVYADPDHDEPRRELARRLREAGDDRGELIDLQLDRAATKGKVTKRETQLVAELRTRVAGSLARIIADDFAIARGFLSQASVADGAIGLGGTEPAWSTVERLSVLSRGIDTSYALLRGSRLRNLRELVGVGPSDAKQLIKGPIRKLIRLELAFLTQPNRWSAEDLAPLPDHLPDLEVLRAPTPGALASLAAIAGRMTKLRDLTTHLPGDQPLEELVALAMDRGITKVRCIGAPGLRAVHADNLELGFELASKTLTMAFPTKLDDQLAAAAVTYLAKSKLGFARLVIEPPPRTNMKAGERGAASWTRRGESMDLAPIFALASERGIECVQGEPAE